MDPYSESDDASIGPQKDVSVLRQSLVLFAGGRSVCCPPIWQMYGRAACLRQMLGRTEVELCIVSLAECMHPFEKKY
jgi:hypothetical protein